MTWSERFVRYQKLQIDGAIRRVYSRLDGEGTVAAVKFDELLRCVRNRGPRILEGPVLDGHNPGVEALANLARFAGAHIRAVSEWPGTMASWRPAVSSLAHHLVCKYEVPRFLSSSWYASGDAAGDRKRNWFVAHASGASFRSLDLPIVMTRKMEHIFLASHDHLAVEFAMRRAELLALGAPPEIVQAVLATRLSVDLNNGEFWRSVWFFLIANATMIDAAEIGPMIDFPQAIRHDRTTVETPAGAIELDPPQPAFSMKGRTVQSLMRLVRDWHHGLARSRRNRSWAPSTLRPMSVEEPGDKDPDSPIRWQITELTSSEQLRTEGAALKHCVASYDQLCCQGLSRIWSLRLWRSGEVRRVMTIEVDPKRRAVIQARGRFNQPASGRPLQLLREWAARERLRIAIQGQRH